MGLRSGRGPDGGGRARKVEDGLDVVQRHLHAVLQAERQRVPVAAHRYDRSLHPVVGRGQPLDDLADEVAKFEKYYLITSI